jgi:hypothetical protein
MSENIVDEGIAWQELSRFAAIAGVEMDERAHYKWKPEKSEDTEDEPKAESDVADYSTLIKAIRRGHITVEENGALTYTWMRKIGDDPSMVLNPDKGPKGWPYGRAMRALSSTMTKTRKVKKVEIVEEDKLGRLDAFVEILAGESVGSMLHITHKRDRDIVTSIASFMISE